MPELGEHSGANKKLLENETYGLAALEALIDDLESRLTAARAGYLDNLNNAQLLKLPIHRIQYICTDTIAVSTTAYLACTTDYPAGNTNTTNELNVWVHYLVTRAGTLKKLVVLTDGAPGAGESYVYTVRKNAADTTLTVTVSDTDKTGADETHTVTVAVGDRITLKVVTSSGAAVKSHIAALEFEAA